MMLTYDWFARTRGWAPSVVDELSLDQLHWFPILESARNEAMEQLRDK